MLRELLKAVRGSIAMREKFSDMAVLLGVSGTSRFSVPNLDVETRWNSLFLMIECCRIPSPAHRGSWMISSLAQRDMLQWGRWWIPSAAQRDLPQWGKIRIWRLLLTCSDVFQGQGSFHGLVQLSGVHGPSCKVQLD